MLCSADKKKKELKQSKKPRVLEKKVRKLKQTGNENKMFAKSKTKVTETIPEDIKTHGSLQVLFKSRHAQRITDHIHRGRLSFRSEGCLRVMTHVPATAPRGKRLAPEDTPSPPALTVVLGPHCLELGSHGLWGLKIFP